jgi:hypothetical protein
VPHHALEAPCISEGLNTRLKISRSADPVEVLLDDELFDVDDFDEDPLELEFDALSALSNAKTISRK